MGTAKSSVKGYQGVSKRFEYIVNIYRYILYYNLFDLIAKLLSIHANYKCTILISQCVFFVSYFKGSSFL